MGGSAKPPTVTQTSSYQMSPEERQLFNLTFPMLQQYAQTPFQQFGGSAIAGFDPNETAAQESYLSSAMPAAQSLVDRQKTTNMQLMDPDFMLNPNQYVQGAANATRNLVTDNLMERILPGVRSGAIADSGMYSGGSSKAGIAEGLAIGKSNRDLSDTVANMYFSNYTTGLNHLGAAVDRAPQVAAAQLFPANIQAAVGGQRRGMEQAKLDETVRNFYMGQEMPLLKAQQLLQALGGMRFGTQTGTATGAVPKPPGLLQTGLGLGGAGLGAFFGGPMGAMAGYGIGSNAGGALGGGK